MFFEGFNYLQDKLNLVVVPLSVGIEVEVAIAKDLLNYDMGLRSKLLFDSDKDYATSFHVSEAAINTIRPRKINSFLFLSDPDSETSSVCYGEMKVAKQEIFIPTKKFNFSDIRRVNIVDFFNESIVYGRNVEVNVNSSSDSRIKLVGFNFGQTNKYVKVIDSSGWFFARVGHEVLEKQIYANVEFKTIVEYSITL